MIAWRRGSWCYLAVQAVGIFHEVGQKFGSRHDVGFWELHLD